MNGHWTYPTDMGTDEWFGFIYMITNTVTSQKYIGKKQYRSWGKKKSPNYGKEMKWREYTSSSKALNADIKELGMASFTFVCMGQYATKGGLSWAENWSQTVREALTEKLEDGTPAYYNRQIMATKFIPKESISDETRTLILNEKDLSND